MTQHLRPGRPRIDPRPLNGDPREELLKAAATLFTRDGYDGTSTRDIASLAGFRQSALFYYFPKKSDLLVELLQKTVEPQVKWLRRLGRVEASFAWKLHELVRFDVTTICDDEHNLAGLMLTPPARRPECDEFWRMRHRLRNGYERVIKGGAGSGEFDVADPRLTTDVIFGLVEGPITWFDRKGRYAADHVAQEIASAALKVVGAALPLDPPDRAPLDHGGR